MAKVKKPAARRTAKKQAKKPATFKSLKAAGKALKRKAGKAPKKLDRNTPAQKDVVIARVEAAGRVQMVTPKGFPPRRADTRWPKEITVGKRHRKDFGDLQDLAASIGDRGGLIQPIAITSSNMLIAGERRMRAWPLSKFSADPIPVRVIDVDSIIAGEWDENAKRKDFTPSEAAAISEEIQKQLSKLAAARMKSGKKADGAAKGNAGDHAARATGFDRRTIDKAKAVVNAAKADPERFGKLQADMDKTGKVDGPYKRLLIMQQKDAIKSAPAPLPMKGPYGAIVVDYPWPAEKDADQETIDKRGRAMRDYPEMAIAEGKKFFAAKEFQALLAPDCRIYFWTTNHHMDAAFELLRAAGFERHSTIGTWTKNKMGNGQVLRGKTEHCILAERGKPLTDIQRPDGGHWTTDWSGEGWEVREDSRKPDAFFDMVEQHTPSARYCEIFSRGGRNDKWDCHGDQVGKFSPEVAKEAQDAILKEIQLTPDQQLLRVLESIEKGETPDLRLVDKAVGRKIDSLIEGKKKFKLTPAGKRELSALRDDAKHAGLLAELPEDIEKLSELYKATLVEFDAAVRSSDRDAATAQWRRGYAILLKASGKTDTGYVMTPGNEKTDSLAGAHVLAAAAAPVGAVPLWGQAGLFRLAVYGTDYVVKLEPGVQDYDFGLNVDLFASDPAKPFITATGRSGIFGIDMVGEYSEWKMIAGKSLSDHLIKDIAEQVEQERKDLAFRQGGRRKKGAPLPELPLPTTVYDLPAEWDGVADPKPIKEKKAGKPAKTKGADKIADAPMQIAKTLPGRDAELIAFAETCGHIVTRAIDHETDSSVATCECGWRYSLKRITGTDEDAVKSRQAQGRILDEMVTGHWTAARNTSPITAGAFSDWLLLTAVQAGRSCDDAELAAREGRGLIKRTRGGKTFKLTPLGEKELASLDQSIAGARAIAHPDAHRTLFGQVFNEMPDAGNSAPTADEPAAQPDAAAGPLLAAASDVLPGAADAAIGDSSREEPPAQGDASVGGSDNEMPAIPAFLDRRGAPSTAEAAE